MGLYTLRSAEYFEVLRRVSEQLDKQNIAYALVGGGGIQARIADLLCRVNKTDIPNVPGLETLLRETKDLDITTEAEESDFIRFFNELDLSNPNISVKPRTIRSKRIILNEDDRPEVYINYQTGPQDLAGLDETFYHECIDTAEKLTLKRGNINYRVHVALPEYLITSKITRNDPKDIWDIGALLKLMKQYPGYCKKFRASRIKDMLQRAGKEEIYGRLEEIRKQILKQ
jgi:hypothetical protein